MGVIRKCAREGCQNNVTGRSDKKWCSLSCYYNCQQYRESMKYYMRQYRKTPQSKQNQREYRQSEEYRERERSRHKSLTYKQRKKVEAIDRLMSSYKELTYLIGWANNEKDPITLLYLHGVLRKVIENCRRMVDRVVVNSVMDFHPNSER